MADYQTADPAPEDDQEDEAIDAAMSESEFQSIVEREITDAIDYIDTQIAPIREAATLYYRGALFGDEQEGRSKAVSRDVHDTVNAILPSLIRVFFGPDKVVEFVPEGPEDVEMAAQATEYVDWIVTRDNPGFLLFWEVFKDALIRKHGVIQYDWSNEIQVTTTTYTGQDETALTKLLEDLQAAQEAAIESMEQTDTGYTVTIKLKRKADRLVIMSVPPEEFLIDRRAIGDLDYTLKGRRRETTHSELVALGYSPDELEDLDGEDGSLDANVEKQARQPALGVVPGDTATDDDSMRRIMYFEGYIRADRDGDGIAELHKICAAGSGFKILRAEQADADNYAVFRCDPEPHSFFGDSIAEKVMDVQKTKSGILRAALDSLAQTIFPRTVVIEGRVNIADVMNTEVGAVVRAQSLDAVRSEVTPFVGQQAFPMLAYMDEVRENRTGMSKSAMGIEPGALQNMTALAAANQFNKSHEHIEITARHLAEGARQLFRGILRMVIQNQRKARGIQFKGNWVTMDPRNWKASMDVTCNVALGGGTNKEKIQVLTAVIQKQEMLMQVLGPQNPLCTPVEYHNAISDVLALSGFKNQTRYFTDPAKAPPIQAPNAPPDPKAAAAAQKAQSDQQKMMLDYRKHQDQMALAMQEMEGKVAELQAKYSTAIQVANIKAQSEALNAKVDLIVQASEADHRERMQQMRPNGSGQGSY